MVNDETVLVWVLRLLTIAALAGGVYVGYLVFNHYQPDPWESSAGRAFGQEIRVVQR